MKVRDVLKLIEDDGWFQVTQKGAIASLSTL
jgi:predicted RNA binding protein YcfA (HicA-like mRNA interferase family)